MIVALTGAMVERMTWTNQFSEICVGFLGFVITEILFF